MRSGESASAALVLLVLLALTRDATAGLLDGQLTDASVRFVSAEQWASTLARVPADAVQRVTYGTQQCALLSDEADEALRSGESADDRLGELAGRCDVYVTGYWSFEVCYGNYIRQFHAPVGPNDPALENLIGRFVRRAGGNIELHEHGSFCTEANAERQARLQYVCAPTLTVLSLREPRPCEYVFDVGVPSLCSERDVPVNNNGTELLAALRNGFCFLNIDQWWRFEVCPGRSSRQYHMANDGRVDNEYSLGNLEVVSERKIVRHRGVTMWQEVYVNGTRCDLLPVQRQIQVLYACAKDGTTRMERVEETSTCKYQARVLTPVLCATAPFRPPVPTRSTVLCSRRADAAARVEGG